MALQTNTKPISTHVTDLSGETTPAHHTTQQVAVKPLQEANYSTTSYIESYGVKTDR